MPSKERVISETWVNEPLSRYPSDVSIREARGTHTVYEADFEKPAIRLFIASQRVLQLDTYGEEKTVRTQRVIERQMDFRHSFVGQLLSRISQPKPSV